MRSRLICLLATISLCALADEAWWLHGLTDHALVIGKAPWTWHTDTLVTKYRNVMHKPRFLPSTGMTELATSDEVYAWQMRFESLFLAQEDAGPVMYTKGVDDQENYTLLSMQQIGTEASFDSQQYLQLLQTYYHGSENVYADIHLAPLRAAGVLGQGQTVAVIDSCVPAPSVEFQDTQITPLSLSGSCAAHYGLSEHGYHVSGTIAADCNGVGMAGVACRANLVSAAISLGGSETACVDVYAQNGDSTRVFLPSKDRLSPTIMAENARNSALQATDGGGGVSSGSLIILEEDAYSGIQNFNSQAIQNKNPTIAAINHSYGISATDEWIHENVPDFNAVYEPSPSVNIAFKDSVGVFAAGNLNLESYLLHTSYHLQHNQNTEAGLNLVQLKVLGHKVNQTSSWYGILTSDQQKSVINVLNFDHMQVGGHVPDLYCIAFDDCKTTNERAWFPSMSYSAGQFVHRTVVANGEDVWSTIQGNENTQTYEAWGGTSMAAPQVSAVVALIKQLQPDNSPQQLADRILYGATPASEAKCVAVDWQKSDRFYVEEQAPLSDNQSVSAYKYFLMQATNPRVVACDDNQVVIHTQRQKQDTDGHPQWSQEGTYVLEDDTVAPLYVPVIESTTVKGLVGQKEVVTKQQYDYQPVARTVNDYVGFGFVNAAQSALPIGGRHLPYPHASRCPGAALNGEQDKGTIVGSDFGICSVQFSQFRLYKGQAIADLLALGDTWWLYRDSFDGAFYDTPSKHFHRRARIASLRPGMVSLAEFSGQFAASRGWLDYHSALSLHTKKADGRAVSVWLDRLIWRNETPLWPEPARMTWKKSALSIEGNRNADALSMTIARSKQERAERWHVAMGWGMPVAEVFTGSVSLAGYNEAENAYPVTLAPFTDGLSVSLAYKYWQILAYAVPTDWSIRGLAEQYGAIAAYKWRMGRQVFFGVNYEPNSLLNMQGSVPMDFSSHMALHTGAEHLLWATNRSAMSALIDVFGMQARSYHDSLLQRHSALWGTQWSLQWIAMDRFQNTWILKLAQPLRVDSGTMDWMVPDYRDIYRVNSDDRPIKFIAQPRRASESARRLRLQASYDMKKITMPFSLRNIGLHVGSSYECVLGGVHNVYDVQNASVWIRMHWHDQ